MAQGLDREVGPRATRRRLGRGDPESARSRSSAEDRPGTRGEVRA